jgi:hypothetical protein
MMSEFVPPCPTGRAPVDIDGTCWCLAARCEAEECAGQTVEVDGMTRCAPDTEGLPECVCRANECTFPCDGVTCEEGLACLPADGTCVPNDCTSFGCPDGLYCDVTIPDCVDDPCAVVTCGADEACRLGTCETSCSAVECGFGERCARGLCVDDLCVGVRCDTGQVCNPADGMCRDNLCAGILCPTLEVCDPDTGTCIADPCTTLHCPEGSRCEAGECVGVGPGVDGGTDVDGGTTGRIDSGPEDDYILGAGGGGCHCRAVGGSSGPDVPSGGPLVALMVALGLGIRRFGRRGR